MTSIARNKVIHVAVKTSEIRSTLTNHRTSVIDDFVCDKITGEVLGTYTRSEYAPEPFDYLAPSKEDTTKFVVDECGSPIAIVYVSTNANHAPTVTTLPTARESVAAEITTGKGRPPSVLRNPLYEIIRAAKIEGVPTPWLDDYVQGAINTGPGVINGKYSVSPTDVARLLHQPEISVASASQHLLNHDHEPMSIRQLQRVVEAARVAMRGIALYLERHPAILARLDLKLDFNLLWLTDSTEASPRGRKEHPKRQEVLRLLEHGEHIKSIVRQTGVSRTTIRKWQLEQMDS
ncbi:hypothetical protein ACVK1X_004932 [Pseudomonas sp. PvR086]